MNVIASQPRVGGLDLLRLFALLFVFFHHACSITNHDPYSAIGDFRFGRLGTTIFFAMSGYFAASTHLSPNQWLWRRLRTIYPAYWVVMILSFVVVGLTQYKPFDMVQVISQLAGLGLYTHPDTLIYVVTWFVSLLLTLYLVAYLAKRIHEIAVISMAFVVVIGLTVRNPANTIICCHVATFLSAYLLGMRDNELVRYLIILLAMTLLSIISVLAATYCLCALILLMLARSFPFQWEAGRFFARYSYEWFLVHGLSLHVAVRLFGESLWLVVPSAVGLALVAAMVLEKTLRRLLPGSKE